MSLIKRNISASNPGQASGSVVNGSTITKPGSNHVPHERRRHGSTPSVGLRKESYFARSRRSGFGSRHAMFRVR